MKGTKLKVCSLFLACAFASGTAFAAEGDYILKGETICRTDKGKKTMIYDQEIFRANTDAGLWSWILIDPDLSDKMKGSEQGIYFFRGEKAKPAGFLPIEEAGACMIEFSPSGEKVLVRQGTERFQHIWLYFIENGKRFVRKGSSFSSEGHPFWIDPHRFLFTQVEAGKSFRVEGGDETWSSVALYDSVEEKLVILKQATDTKGYVITGCDHDNGVLEVLESSVKDTKDWGDPDKIEYTEIKVEIPAAG